MAFVDRKPFFPFLECTDQAIVDENRRGMTLKRSHGDILQSDPHKFESKKHLLKTDWAKSRLEGEEWTDDDDIALLNCLSQDGSDKYAFITTQGSTESKLFWTTFAESLVIGRVCVDEWHISHGSGNALWDLLSMMQRRNRVFNFELPPFFLFVSGTPMP